MFTPNGTLREEWVADGSESNFVLGRILEPLEDLRDRLLVLQGLDSDVAFGGAGDGHQSGMGCMLTGRRLPEGPFKSTDDKFTPAGLPDGITIDQRIAQKIDSTDNAFRTLPLGIRTPRQVDSWSRISFTGPGRAVSPYNNALDVYNRITGLARETSSRETGDASMARLESKRRSAYFYVRDEFRRFRDYVGPDDRIKLDEHLEHVDTLETDLNRMPRACFLPDDVRADARGARNDVPKISNVHKDIAAHALGCDLSRVVTLQYSRSVGTLKYEWVGVTENHHDLSHKVDLVEDAYEKIVKIDRWNAEQFCNLVRSIEAQEAEDGSSMLDHTVVLWVNELDRGSVHSRRNMSWLMAGNVDGYFNTGRAVQLEGRSTNDLFVTLLHGFGIDDETFGDPEFNEGPISELTA